jgi:ComF family protein
MTSFSKIGKSVIYQMRQGLKAAADLILPRVCVVCGDRLLLNERIICLHCLADLPLTHFWEQKHNPMSERFNAVIQHGLEKAWDGMEWQMTGLLSNGTREKYAYATALFFYSHEAPYRHILYNLKYEGRIDVGRYFGRILGAKLAASSTFKDVDYVMPVPLHWTRKWKRGYNQAEVIAREVAAALGAQLDCGILFRRRRTRTQTKLDIKGKATNVENAFEAHLPHSGSSCIKHVILIDDVFTSGSTLHACFKALRTVFPPSVRISVATLAFVGEV